MSYEDYINFLQKGIDYPKDWRGDYCIEELYYEEDIDRWNEIREDILLELYFDVLELTQLRDNLINLHWEDINNG